MVATINNQKFEGTGMIYTCIDFDFACFLIGRQNIWCSSLFRLGPSKKLAKNAAAKAALATLCDISYSPMQMKSTEAAPIESNKKQTFELPQTFADGIGK